MTITFIRFICKICFLFLCCFMQLAKFNLSLDFALCLSVYLSFLYSIVYLITMVLSDKVYYYFISSLSILLPFLFCLCPALVMCHCLALFFVLTILVTFLLLDM